jgi:hypothetical protein
LGATVKQPSVIVVMLLGCGGGSTVEPDLAELFPEPCLARACANGSTIASTADFVAAIDSSVRWTDVGEYTSGCLPASDDHVVDGAVTVRGADIPLPPNNMNGFAPETRFVLRDAPAGVTCGEPEDLFDFTLCESITIANTTIRLRAVVIDIHPAPGDLVAVVEVLPACETPCGATQLACEASKTCWNTERDHCAYCLGGTNEACACWRDGELEPDDTPCEIFVSGDVVVGGTCRAGACVIE